MANITPVDDENPQQEGSREPQNPRSDPRSENERLNLGEATEGLRQDIKDLREDLKKLNNESAKIENADSFAEIFRKGVAAQAAGDQIFEIHLKDNYNNNLLKKNRTKILAESLVQEKHKSCIAAALTEHLKGEG